MRIFDFEWRGYDPALIRTWQQDPLAELYYSESPYSWVANNPINFIDPDGRSRVPDGSSGFDKNSLGFDPPSPNLFNDFGPDCICSNIDPPSDEELENAKSGDIVGTDNDAAVVLPELIFNGSELNEGSSTAPVGNSLNVASIGINLSLGIGLGIEYGGIEDGENSRAFLTVKYLQGIDISGYFEGGTISSISNERINAKAIQGPGSEVSLGALLYSYTFGGDGYLTNQNSLNPLLFRSRTHSLGIGIDVSRTDASTYTWTFEPAETPQYIKLKMGGL